MSTKASFTIAAALVCLSACAEQTAPSAAPTEIDPLVARALHDPLMVDPDLAYRNEANAALTIGFDHALPPLEPSDFAARRARDEARLVLLEDGAIEQVPDFASLDFGRSLADARGNALAMGEAYDVPTRCLDRLEENFSWAAQMPSVARIMPHGLIRQAAGADGEACNTRVLTYWTAAKTQDVLEWHYNLASRANLNISLFSEPETAMFAEKRGTNVLVHLSEAPGGMTAVDIIYWVE